VVAAAATRAETSLIDRIERSFDCGLVIGGLVIGA
jgi:hypothetical protein